MGFFFIATRRPARSTPLPYTTPFRSAVATLREALRWDPGNHDAEQRLIEAAERLALVAHDAHEVGLQAEARLYLELALTVRPDVGEWRQLRDRWVNDIKPDD